MNRLLILLFFVISIGVLIFSLIINIPPNPCVVFTDKQILEEFKIITDFPGEFPVPCEVAPGKLGFMNENGEVVIPGPYDYVEYFSDGLAAVGKLIDRKMKYGYVDLSGKAVIDFQFDEAGLFKEGLAAVKIGRKYGYIDKKGEVVIPAEFDGASIFSEGFARVRRGHEWGVLGQKGNLMVEPQYFRLGPFLEGLSYACNREMCGFINTSGEIAIDFLYDDAGDFRSGLAPVRTDHKWIYINKAGENVFGKSFDKAISFSEGLGLVRVNYVYSYINERGVETIRLKGNRNVARPFKNGLAVVGDDGRPEGSLSLFFIDKKGNEKALCSPRMQAFGEGRNEFERKLRPPYKGSGTLYYGFIDKTGKLIIQPQYSYVSDFSEGKAYVDYPAKFINQEGQAVYSFPREEPWSRSSEVVGLFSEGLVSARSCDNKCMYGFIDELGQWVIPPGFFAVKPFNEGLAPVQIKDDSQDNPWGYVDKKGNIVISPRFHDAEQFYNGLAAVTVNMCEQKGAGYKSCAQKRHYINQVGSVMISDAKAGPYFLDDRHRSRLSKRQLKNVLSGYSFVEPLIPGYAKTGVGWEYGFIDKQGSFAVPAKFDRLKPFSEGLAPVAKADKWGFINMRGEVAIDFIYDDADPFSEGLARVKKNDKFGYINTSGKFVIRPMFIEEANFFEEGMALVKLNGKYGFIDSTGNFFIEPQFDAAQPFSEGLARVGLGGIYVSHKKEGCWISYFKGTRNRLSELNYKDGKLDGECKWYYENGNLKQVTLYKDGIKDGPSAWYYESGGVREKTPFKNNKLHGMHYFYYESGELQEEGPYEDGKEQGTFILYNKDKSLKKKIFFEKGQRIREEYPE